MKRLVTTFLVLSVAGGAIGYFSGTASHEAPNERSADRWTSLAKPIDYSESASRFRSSLLSSSSLQASKPPSPDTSPSVATGTEGSPTGDTYTPNIISIAEVDGIPTVQVRTNEGYMTSLRRGDVLFDGWIISEVSDAGVRVEQDDEELFFQY